MIDLRDVDLRDLDPFEPQPTHPVWILVRTDGHVLGEVRFPEDYRHFSADDVAGSPQRAPLLKEFLTTAFARQLATHRLSVDDSLPAAGANPSDVTIAICTHDRADHVSECLRAMSHLDPAPGQILVVDNGPTNADTRRAAMTFGVDYVTAPVLGLNRARNVARLAASGTIVAFVDDDARVDSGFVRAVTSGFLDEDVGAVSGLVLPAELATPAQVSFERHGGMRKGYERRLFSPGSVGIQSFRLGVGTNMSFRIDALERAGGFDETIGVGTPSRGGGDLDALWRVLDCGFDVMYEPDAIVRHFHRRSRSELVQQHRDYGTAYAATLTRRAHDHSRRAARNELVRWHVRRHLLEPARALRSRDRDLARLLLAEASGSWAWHRRRRQP